MKINIVKVVSIAGTVLSIAGTLLSSWSGQKTMKDTIKAEVANTVGNQFKKY